MEGYVDQDDFFVFDTSSTCGAWQQILSHSQHLTSECTDYIPIGQLLTCFSTEEPDPPDLYIQRALQSSQTQLHGVQSTLLYILYQGPKILYKDTGPQEAIVTVLKCHCHFSKSFLW